MHAIRWNVVFALTSVAFLPGCSFLTPPLERPIIEDHALNHVNAFSVIPSRRMVIMKREPVSDPDGKSIRVCAEPPADVTDNIASTLAAAAAASGPLSSGKTLEASLAYERTLSTVAQVLFKRSQGLQLYRDRMYYLCQDWMNGVKMTDAEYQARADAYFKDIIELIRIELPHLAPAKPAAPDTAKPAPKPSGAGAATGNTAAGVGGAKPKPSTTGTAASAGGASASTTTATPTSPPSEAKSAPKPAP